MKKKHSFKVELYFDIDSTNYDIAFKKLINNINKTNKIKSVRLTDKKIENICEHKKTVIDRDLINIKIFEPEEIFSNLDNLIDKDNRIEIIIDNKKYSIKNSSKYLVFKNNLFCVSCGLKGSKLIFQKSINNNSYHFNLYAEEDNNLILITKDHIMPSCHGGNNTISNFQTMCSICNNLKGSHKISIENIGKLRKIYNENKMVLSRKEITNLINLAINKMKKIIYVKKPKKEKKNFFASNKNLIVYQDECQNLQVDIIEKFHDNSIASIKENTKLHILKENEYGFNVFLSNKQICFIPLKYVNRPK